MYYLCFITIFANLPELGLADIFLKNNLAMPAHVITKYIYSWEIVNVIVIVEYDYHIRCNNF